MVIILIWTQQQQLITQQQQLITQQQQQQTNYTTK